MAQNNQENKFITYILAGFLYTNILTEIFVYLLIFNPDIFNF